MSPNAQRKPDRRTWLAKFPDTCAECKEPIKRRQPVTWLSAKIAHESCAHTVWLKTRAASPAAARAARHRMARKQGHRKATAAQVRAAAAEAERNRDAILRGDTFRAGGLPEAPSGPSRRSKARK
ncbi:hypothetical protein ACFWPX_24930 [Nocardia sp. NPDC058518]|uniref:hypothetical protein n=1 Tax=Nocardia sp. NPDC058518 TaxID=3346534 RepID=UPI003667A9F2